MPRTRPAYPDEFRKEAVATVRGDRAVRDVAESLGVSQQSPRKWVKQPNWMGENAMTGRAAPSARSRADSATPVSVAREPLGVSRSGFYAWRTRPPSRRALHGAWLTERIKEIWKDQRPGAEKAGARDDPGAGGASGRRSGRARLPTGRPELALGRRHHLPAHLGGWLYLAAVQDAFSRRIVGRAMAEHMRSELVVDALRMAIARRQPKPGLIHHSDQGSQFVSLPRS